MSVLKLARAVLAEIASPPLLTVPRVPLVPHCPAGTDGTVIKAAVLFLSALSQRDTPRDTPPCPYSLVERDRDTVSGEGGGG